MKKLKQTFFARINKVILSLPALLILLSCSKHDSEITPARKLGHITPSTVEIGDTITIEGTGLNCSTCYITFNNERDYKSISASETQIVAIVPTLFNEKVSIMLWDNNSPVDSATINLVGFFPLQGVPFSEPWGMQAMDENTFIVFYEQGLFLTEDGGYHWSTLAPADFNTLGFFFLNKDTGWIVSSKMNTHEYVGKYVVYFTNNAGQSFQALDTISCQSLEFPDMLFFKSPNEGYVLSNFGRIYETSNNSQFENIYELPWHVDFPPPFTSLSVYNNTIMSTGPALLTGKNNVFKYGNLSGQLYNVQVVDDNEAYVIKDNKLFFSNDAGENWKQQNDLFVHDFHFSDKINGVMITSESVQSYQQIFFTHDGGVTGQFASGHSPVIEYTWCMAFSGNVGLMALSVRNSGYRTWKYVER
jgi:photosystem II stability/assembly factor-like uncharacterized protein